MATQDRKKSPRAPSIPLDEALDRALRVYDKERTIAAPADVFAQGMGYKDANNGRALAALASLRYYGLVERGAGGMLAVSKDVEAYKFAPTEELRRSFLRKFVAQPPLFAELLDRYSVGLPSDGTLKYELIQRGFLPATAEGAVASFRRSVEFAQVYAEQAQPRSDEGQSQDSDGTSSPTSGATPTSSPPGQFNSPGSPSVPTGVFANTPVGTSTAVEEVGHDRIPVRLSGGRRAWLVIPSTFYEADKLRLKAQIDLLLTEDDS